MNEHVAFDLAKFFCLQIIFYIERLIYNTHKPCAITKSTKKKNTIYPNSGPLKKSPEPRISEVRMSISVEYLWISVEKSLCLSLTNENRTTRLDIKLLRIPT